MSIRKLQKSSAASRAKTKYFLWFHVFEIKGFCNFKTAGSIYSDRFSFCLVDLFGLGFALFEFTPEKFTGFEQLVEELRLL